MEEVEVEEMCNVDGGREEDVVLDLVLVLDDDTQQQKEMALLSWWL